MRRLRLERLLAWGVALGVLAGAAYVARQRQIYGVDFVPIHDGARSLRMFQDPYQLEGQYGPHVYPPVVSVVLLPLAFVSQQTAVAFGLLLSAMSLTVLAMSLASLLGYSWRGRCAAGLVAALAVSHIGFSTLAIGNLSMLLGAGSSLALALAASGRWLRAALVLGVILAIKPVVLPMLLIFAVSRRWRDGMVAVAVPAALNLAALPLLAEPARFFTDTLPMLAAGATVPFEFNLAIGAVVERAGGSGTAQIAARVAVGLASLAVVDLARRRTLGTERLLIIGLVPVAGLVLASGTDHLHYALPLLPVLALLAARGGLLVRATAAGSLLLLAYDFGFGGTTAQLLILVAGGAAAVTSSQGQPPSPTEVAAPQDLRPDAVDPSTRPGGRSPV